MFFTQSDRQEVFDAIIEYSEMVMWKRAADNRGLFLRAENAEISDAIERDRD